MLPLEQVILRPKMRAYIQLDGDRQTLDYYSRHLQACVKQAQQNILIWKPSLRVDHQLAARDTYFGLWLCRTMANSCGPEGHSIPTGQLRRCAYGLGQVWG